MDLTSLRQDMIVFSINQNPTTITIKRTKKARVDGSYREDESSLGPYTVRIFNRSDTPSKTTSEMAGIKQTDSNWGLLADRTVDIQDGPGVRDEFDVPNMGRFVVHKVNPQIVQGLVVGYQVDLERVE